MAKNEYLLGLFADELATPGAGERFVAQLDEWQTMAIEREFAMNVVDVKVNFVGGWAEIVDVLEADRSHRVSLTELRTIAQNTPRRRT